MQPDSRMVRAAKTAAVTGTRVKLFMTLALIADGFDNPATLPAQWSKHR
jgi:hypothetical protein